MESHRPDFGGIWAIRGRADPEAETLGFRPHGQVHDVHNFMPSHRYGRVGFTTNVRSTAVRSALLHPETSPDSLHVVHVSRRFRKPLMSCRLDSGVDYAEFNVWSHIPASEDTISSPISGQ